MAIHAIQSNQTCVVSTEMSESQLKVHKTISTTTKQLKQQVNRSHKKDVNTNPPDHLFFKHEAQFWTFIYCWFSEFWLDSDETCSLRICEKSAFSTQQHCCVVCCGFTSANSSLFYHHVSTQTITKEAVPRNYFLSC